MMAHRFNTPFRSSQPKRAWFHLGTGRWAATLVALALFALFPKPGESQLPSFAVANASAAPRIALERLRIIVDEVNPRAEVALLAIERRRIGHAYTAVNRIALEGVDDDEDGRVVFDLAEPLAGAVVVLAVDLESGDSAVAASEGVRLYEVEAARRRMPSGRDDLFEVDSPRLELLWSRAHVGAWRSSVRDASAEDEDLSADGRVRVSPRVFRGIGRQPKPPPPVFRPGDTLVGVDFRTMEYLSLRIAKGEE